MDYAPPEDFEDFATYVRSRNGSAPLTLEECVEDFREYQRQLADLKVKLREAEESSARGESRPLDIEDVIRRGKKRLAEQGIVD